jgi:triacylglycerol esterase/lipase EstA (alpha/beta hydrolase family)
MLSRENGPVSRRRRALLLAVVTVAVIAGVVTALVTRGDGPVPGARVAQDRPGPVLLVPGYGGSTAALDVLAEVLRAHGRDATVVRLPGDGTGDLREAARALDAAARGTGAESVDVVGYSAGGVTARYWVKELGGAARVRRVVTLGSPHHGSTLAALGQSVAPGACPTACRQLVPGSGLLDRLNAGDETPDGPQWLSLWTAGDETVTPPDSARLEGAVDVVLQDVCAGIVVSHSQLPRVPLVQGLVLAAIAPADVAQPTAADCAALTAAPASS